MKSVTLSRILVGWSCLAAVAAAAQVPPKLGYQGQLLKADGTPETGVVGFKFALFAASTGGVELWSETQQLGLTDGFYATFLGDATPQGCAGAACTGLPLSVLDGSERFLELTVAGVPLTPRQRVASVAYALKSTDARNVTGGTVVASSATVAGSPVLSTASVGAGIAVSGPPTAPVLNAVYGMAAGTAAEGNDARLSDARNPLPGSASYIQNQTAGVQAASFSISGSAAIAGNVGIGTTTPNVGGASGNFSVVSMLGPVAGILELGNRANTAATNSDLGYISFYNGTTHSAYLNAQTGGTDSSFMRFGTKAAGQPIAERMRISQMGNVGIGTPTPDETLSVNGNISLVGDNTNTGFVRFLKLYGSSDPASNPNRWAGIGQFDNGGNNVNELAFFYGHSDIVSEGMRLNYQGNVGVGIPTPNSRLEVRDLGNGGTVANIRGSNTGTGPGNYSQLAVTNEDNSVTALTGIALRQHNGANVPRTAGSIEASLNTADAGSENGYLLFTTMSGGAATEKLRINSAGNVGIGTPAPTSRLHVEGGDITLSKGGTTYLTTQTIAYPMIFLKGPIINSVRAGRFGLYERTAFMSDNVYFDGAAWVPDDANFPRSAILIQDGAMRFQTQVAGQPNGLINRMILDNTGNLGIGTAGAALYKLDVNGTIRGFGITDSSDVRLKHNIRPLSHQASRLMRLKGVSYYWNDAEHGTDRQLGLIAQDVESVYPELVETDVKGMKSVNYSHLAAPIVEAFKELYAKVLEQNEALTRQQRQLGVINDKTASLEAEVARLKREGAALKGYLCEKDPRAAICR